MDPDIKVKALPKLTKELETCLALILNIVRGKTFRVMNVL